MEQHANKTIMCSVLFLDIVEYSKKSVSGQVALKDGFNAFLAAAIRGVPVNDRIILDTGDGAAISFMGDVEDALKAALILREKLLGEGVHMDPPLLVRMGINLGPVRLVKDINGQPNIVGDGINVAQRVMGFAEPSQVLVSRSYYDAVSRLSQDYTGMFHYQGSRTDKHVREHEIYAIGHPGDVTATQQKPGDKGLNAAQRVNGWIQAARAAYQNASSQQRALSAAALAGTLLLLIVVAVKIMYRPVAPLPQVAEAPAPAVTQAPAPAVVQAEPAVARAASEVAATPPKVATPPKTAVTVEEKKPKVVRPAQEKSMRAPAAQGKAAKDISTTRTLEETTAVEPGPPALVSVAVTPWGEIYLDGRMQGVSPPLAELQVAPGTHEIEIRNTTFPVYTQSIHVKAGEQIKIKHKFAN
ncbi:MAG: PEGA domain-containing protein [Betaproteobacteria bacterium]|nr:PEGA domain-containing protein [Betaproteobacteria bacterium]